MNYTPLFQPISVGPLRLKNRFVMAPMSVHMTEDGSVSDAGNRLYRTPRHEAGCR